MTRAVCFLSLSALIGLAGCDDDEPADADAEPAADAGADGSAEPEPDTGPEPDAGPGGCIGEVGEGVRAAAFVDGALAEPIEVVDCTLDDGTETTCHRVVIRGAPANHEAGPWCPRNIADDAESGGIWLESGEVYDVDGAFIAGLAEFYSDENWQLYDPETGDINVTTTQASCEAAARPDVDPAYQNHCVECELSYVDGGVESEHLIPTRPVRRDTPAEIGGQSKVGVALTGVGYDPPAPTDAILAAYTIAAFDDCGGHVNLVAGYHYHAATGCAEEGSTQCDGHAPLIGYALDGYAIHAMTGDDGVEPDDLDACRGHTDAVRGYHYHAASAGENMFIGCYAGHIVGDAGGGPGPGEMPDMGAMACADGQQQMCCGDGVCDGPETAENCAEDCQ